MGMHETAYEHSALEQHFRYFGDAVTYTPLGGAALSITAQVMDLPDGSEFIGRRFRVRSSEVTSADVGDTITTAEGSWKVVEVSRIHGGSYDLYCEHYQPRG